MGKTELMLGNEAVARAVYEAGVSVATAYPGTPSTEITENIAKYGEIYCEWSPNEKVALEVAVGASIAGARAICSMKHVGLNVAADPLFTASYTGTNSGLVVMVADDPGMHSSQNEQDTRYYGLSAKVPVLEPSDSQECLDFVKIAFDLSEEFDTPVIVRLTTRVAHSRSLVEVSERQERPLRDYVKNPGKYVMMPAMARARHLVVEKRMRLLEQYSEATEINKILYTNDGKAVYGPSGKQRLGIIASGISNQYTMEADIGAPVLKLGMVHPLPAGLIRNFADRFEAVYIVEELSPFIEDFARKIGINAIGKEIFPATGELSAGMIKDKIMGAAEPTATASAVPATTSASAEPAQLPTRPPVLCPGCPHRSVFYVLRKMKLIVTGDIGCYTLGALPPLEAMDTCICMGASVSVAHGIDKARGKEFASRTVAVVGDSTFLHSGITPLIDIVYNKGMSTVLILDNRITGMTGHQQNPSSGFTIKGEEAPRLNIQKLCEAIGVPSVRKVDPFDVTGLELALKEELAKECPSVIIAERLCALLKTYVPGDEVEIDREKCKRCMQCMKISCAAIVKKDNDLVINKALCVRCGLCSTICKFGAITKI